MVSQRILCTYMQKTEQYGKGKDQQDQANTHCQKSSTPHTKETRQA